MNSHRITAEGTATLALAALLSLTLCVGPSSYAQTFTVLYSFAGPNGNCGPDSPSQAYYSSPAYWFDGSTYWLYYSATMNDDSNGISPPDVPPEALNAYQLPTMGSTGPVSQTPYANSGASNAQTYPILFCDYAPTPSVSSKGNMLLQPENVVLTATRLCHPFLD